MPSSRGYDEGEGTERQGTGTGGYAGAVSPEGTSQRSRRCI